MAFQFPWTNLHELNLDWFLSKFKQFTNNYLGTTATAQSVPYGTQPTVTVTGGELDDDTDIVDPFTFNFKIPAGQQGEQGEQGVPGQDGFSPIATVTKSGTVATITITDVNGTTTTTISDGEVTQAQLDTKAPVILCSETGTIVKFTDSADNMPMSEFIIGIAPLQTGSGTPAPGNTRPISGWTGSIAYRAGANLFNITNRQLGTPAPANSSNTTSPRVMDTAHYYSGLRPDNYYNHNNITEYDVSNGTVKVRATNNSYGIGFPVEVKANTTYTLHGTASPYPHLGVGFYDAEWHYLGTTGKTGDTLTFTTLADTAYAVLVFQSTSTSVATTWTDIQLEVGSASNYEPYTAPTTGTTSWQSDAGTVYGGTLEVTTGLLTVTHSIVDLGTLTWNVVSNNSSMYSTGINSIALHNVTNPTVWCSNLPQTDSASVYSGTEGIALHTNGNIRCVFDGCTLDPDTFKSEVSGWMFVFPLATPQIYQLTPQQIITALGTSTIWCNTGDVTVTYPADTKLYIEQLTKPTEDDMVANTAISNGTFFMIGNNLYKANTTIASGSQIIPGTNATPMSLADALNSL